MKHSKRTLSFVMAVIMTLSVIVITAMPVSANTADCYTVLLLDDADYVLTDEIQNAAKDLCTSLLLANIYNEIAIVCFDIDCSSIGFTSDYSTLEAKIDSPLYNENAYEGRNIYGALTEANSLLQGVPEYATKNIVLFSNGLPEAGAWQNQGHYGNAQFTSSYDRRLSHANAVYTLAQEYKNYYNIYTVGFYTENPIGFQFIEEEHTFGKTLLSDICNKGYYEGQNEAALNSLYADLVTSAEELSVPQFPAGYDFHKDSYNFKNFDGYISLKYFETIFGEGKGFGLWKKNYYVGGHCFGMSYTTAAMLNGLPHVQSIRSLSKNTPTVFDPVLDAQMDIDLITIGNLSITPIDYIRYAHIWQWSSSWINSCKWNSIDEIYDIVSDYLANDRIGVTITMKQRDGHNAHGVLAVGIDGNRIILDDPMNKDGFEYLEIGENGYWEYSYYRQGWNKNTCDICYSEDYYMPYQLLLTGKTVEADPDGVDGIQYIIKGTEKADLDKNLLSVPKNAFISGAENTIKLINIDNGDDETTSKCDDMFWIPKNQINTVTVSTPDNNEHEYMLAGDEIVISATTTDSSEVSFNMQEFEAAFVKLKTTPMNPYKLSMVTFSDEDTPIEITVSGLANDNEVYAEQAESGLMVHGLNDILVVYYDNHQEIDRIEADVTDGKTVNIIIDDENDTVTTDFVKETETPTEPDTPINDDSVCKYCNQKHDSSFIGRIMALIHSILWFFKNLFK